MTIRYCYNDEYKQIKAREYKAQLRKVAKALGLVRGQYDLRFNPGGIAVWGEVTLHTDKLYIQASYGCDIGVLVRTCKGRRDYTGGMNHWFPFSMLANDPNGFAKRANMLIG